MARSRLSPHGVRAVLIGLGVVVTAGAGAIATASPASAVPALCSSTQVSVWGVDARCDTGTGSVRIVVECAGGSVVEGPWVGVGATSHASCPWNLPMTRSQIQVRD